MRFFCLFCFLVTRAPSPGGWQAVRPDWGFYRKAIFPIERYNCKLAAPPRLALLGTPLWRGDEGGISQCFWSLRSI